MKTILIIYALLITGCADQPDDMSNHISSGDSHLVPAAVMYNSVTSRIHAGMSMAEVRSIYPDCTRFRFYGPLIDTSDGTSTYFEEWGLVIRCSDGDVKIHSTSGRESDLEHGIVKNVSYGTAIGTTTKEDSQQSGPAYPPQGVGSADP